MSDEPFPEDIKTVLMEPSLDELDDILGEDEDSGNDSEDERTLLKGTDFKLEWCYQQISTAVEYLSTLTTILGGGGKSAS